MGVRKFAEVLGHQFVVAGGVGFVGEVLEFVPGGIEQTVVQRPALGCQGRAALFDFPEPGAVAAARVGLIGERDRLVQCLETGLAQQDRALTAGRTFDYRFRGDAVRRHLRLHDVDV
ncbi:hypothetical protein D3C80_1673040 [compost metagenome]